MATIKISSPIKTAGASIKEAQKNKEKGNSYIEGAVKGFKNERRKQRLENLDKLETRIIKQKEAVELKRSKNQNRHTSKAGKTFSLDQRTFGEQMAKRKLENKILKNIASIDKNYKLSREDIKDEQLTELARHALEKGRKKISNHNIKEIDHAIAKFDDQRSKKTDQQKIDNAVETLKKINPNLKINDKEKTPEALKKIAKNEQERISGKYQQESKSSEVDVKNKQQNNPIEEVISKKMTFQHGGGRKNVEVVNTLVSDKEKVQQAKKNINKIAVLLSSYNEPLGAPAKWLKKEINNINQDIKFSGKENKNDLNRIANQEIANQREIIDNAIKRARPQVLEKSQKAQQFNPNKDLEVDSKNKTQTEQRKAKTVNTKKDRIKHKLYLEDETDAKKPEEQPKKSIKEKIVKSAHVAKKYIGEKALQSFVKIDKGMQKLERYTQKTRRELGEMKNKEPKKLSEEFSAKFTKGVDGREDSIKIIKDKTIKEDKSKFYTIDESNISAVKKFGLNDPYNMTKGFEEVNDRHPREISLNKNNNISHSQREIIRQQNIMTAKGNARS